VKLDAQEYCKIELWYEIDGKLILKNIVVQIFTTNIVD
jgi:hypothetical protein